MRDTHTARMRASLLAFPLCAALLGGCKPEKPGGYQAVQYRDTPKPVEAAYPEPPQVSAAVLAAGRPQQVKAPAGVQQAAVDAGGQVFGRVCSACHGNGGVGTPAAPALNDKQWLHVTGQVPELVALVKAGVAQPKQYPGAMPPRGGQPLTDEEVDQVSAYVFAISQQGEQ